MLLTFRLAAVAAALTLTAFAAGSAGAGVQDDVFTVHDLVADSASGAPAVDASLVNAWGLSAGPTTP